MKHPFEEIEAVPRPVKPSQFTQPAASVAAPRAGTSDVARQTTSYNLKIVAAAKAYCDAHREDYELMKNSDSMDVDAEFMLLFQAVEPIETSEPAASDVGWELKRAPDLSKTGCCDGEIWAGGKLIAHATYDDAKTIVRVHNRSLPAASDVAEAEGVCKSHGRDWTYECPRCRFLMAGESCETESVAEPSQEEWSYDLVPNPRGRRGLTHSLVTKSGQFIEYVRCRKQGEKIAQAHNKSLSASQQRVRALEEALKEVAEGKGQFSLDPLTHASNTIESMKSIARSALAPQDPQPANPVVKPDTK